MKSTIISYLIAVAFLFSLFASVTLMMSHVYRHVLDDKDPSSDANSVERIRAQLNYGMRTSVEGKWKPGLKRAWVVFIICDLVAIVIVALL